MPLFQKLQASMSSSNINPVHSNKDHAPLRSTASNNNIINTGSHHPFKLSIELESPPIILYGLPHESSGSLLSGQLTFNIDPEVFKHEDRSSDSISANSRPSNKRTHSSQNTLQQLSQTLSNLNLSPSNSNNVSPLGSKQNSSSNLLNLLNLKDHILINSVQLCLVQKIHYAKPFLAPSNTIANCTNCKNRSVELARWDILSQSHNIPAGKHSYPFSHLLPGNLPATTTLGSSSLTSIKYELVAITSYNNRQNHQTLVKLVLPLNISRSILRGPDRNSLRVFPPTDVTATAVLPNVIYPKSSFALELKLDGVCSAEKRWRMRRVGWRIEEQVKIKGHSCPHHQAKLKILQEQVKKNQAIHKYIPVKRNRQSGPTSSVTLSSIVPTVTPNDQTPQASATNNTTSNDDANENNDANDDDNDSIHTSNTNLHPSDHANEELRQQQAQQQREEELRLQREVFLCCDETRTVASGDLRNGWKSDFTGKGKIELVADLACFNLSSAAGPHITHVSSEDPIDQSPVHSTVSCDIDDPILGICASHTLIVEVVIAEEILQTTANNSLTPTPSNADSIRSKSNAKPDQRLSELSPVFASHMQPSTTPTIDPPNPLQPTSSAASSKTETPSTVGVPTGSARVLRMQFKLCVTERSGLGIAWDDEVPPMYDDVSALSPPTYDKYEELSPSFQAEIDNGANPPLYPLNFAPAHTHTHLNGGTTTPGVIYGIGNTPTISPRPSGNFQSLHGALEMDEFSL